MRLPDGEVYVSVKQAAAHVHVIPGTIHYHIDAGNLSFIHVDRRYWIALTSLKALYGKDFPFNN